MLNKRKENRINVLIPIPVNKIIFNNKEVKSPNKIFPATIVDISTNGALMMSPLSVPVNLKFIFELRDDNSKIMCFLEILRKECCDEGYYYGCKLRPVFENDKERFRIYLLKKYVHNLNYKETYIEVNR